MYYLIRVLYHWPPAVLCTRQILSQLVSHISVGQAQTPIGYVGKMLEGFKLSSTPLVQKKHFSPPTLPRNYRPVHVFRKQDDEKQSGVWFPGADTRKAQFRKPDDTENQSGQGPPASARGKPQFTDAVSRGIALGEQPFVGTYQIYKPDQLA